MSRDAAPFVVREGTPGDAEGVAALARALNEHERDPVEHLDLDAVRRDMLGPDAAVEVLVAARDDAILGYAAFHPAYDSTYAARGLFMIDLYVDGAARELGVGRALIAAVSAAARARGMTYVSWTANTWNDRANAMYAAIGSTNETILYHSLYGEAFEKLAASGGTAGTKEN